MLRAQLAKVALAAALAGPCAAHAAPRALRIGAMPMVARTDAATNALDMAGAGVAVSYSPWWHYTVDLQASCLVARQTSEQYRGQLDSHALTERFRRRYCDVVAGLSYRLGYPATHGASARLGLVLGLGAGYRRTTKHDRTTWFGDEVPGSELRDRSYWEPIATSRIGIEYMPAGTLSAGLYLYLTSSSISKDEIDIEPALGLLITGYFLT